ncbi:MAG: hypothetical protein ABEJ70_01570 [Halobacteriaceae archaeon]
MADDDGGWSARQRGFVGVLFLATAGLLSLHTDYLGIIFVVGLTALGVALCWSAVRSALADGRG